MRDRWQGFRHHDESKRRTWQDPESILRRIGLEAGHVFVDVGCGNGFFALPAARIVGPGGAVIGIDVDASGIDELRRRAEREGLENVRLTVGRAEETRACEGCADIVFFGNDLHDFEDPEIVLENALYMIRPAGLLVDLDWKKAETPFGPPLEVRFTEEEASGMISRAGFVVVDIGDSGEYHYLALARPAGPPAGTLPGSAGTEKA